MKIDIKGTEKLIVGTTIYDPNDYKWDEAKPGKRNISCKHDGDVNLDADLDVGYLYFGSFYMEWDPEKIKYITVYLENLE